MDSLPRHLGVRKRNKRKPAHVDEGVLDRILKEYPLISGFVDIGCGPADMCKVAKHRGLDVIGIDGDPCGLERENVTEDELIIHDYTKGDTHLYDLNNDQMKLAWSVEFLEHVEEAYQDNYMYTFGCCEYAFVTAAQPGQKGWHHVNCQPKEYWVEIFGKYGFAYDEEFTKESIRHSTLPRDSKGRWAGKPTVIERNSMFFRK